MIQRLHRIYYGWWVVTTGFVASGLAIGVYFLGFSVFFLPFARDLKISRAAASLPFSGARTISVASSPLLGLAADRLGPARVMLGGSALAGLGYVLLSRSSSYVVFLLIFVLVVTPGVQGGLDSPTAVAVSRWFRRRRNLAFALTSTGFALGGATITPLLALAVHSFGWRTTALGVGFLIWAIVMPMSAVFRRSPDERDPEVRSASAASARQGNPSVVASAAASTFDSQDFTFRMALGTRTYWFLALSYGIRAMVWAAISIHLVAIMVWKSLDESTAGLLVGAFPIFWIPATLAVGWAGDRWSKQRIAAACGLISSLGLLLLATWDAVEVWQMLLVFVLLSPNEASWPLAWAMLADQFGRKEFGLLRGGMQAILGFVSIGAPIYSGWIFDTTGGYFRVVLPAALLLVAAGLLNWLMPPATRGIPVAASSETSEAPDPFEAAGPD